MGALQGRHFSAQRKHEPAVTFTLKTWKVERGWGFGGGSTEQIRENEMKEKMGGRGEV